jgi:hypothetical protein
VIRRATRSYESDAEADDLLAMISLLRQAGQSKAHLVFGDWATRVDAATRAYHSQGMPRGAAFERALVDCREGRSAEKELTRDMTVGRRILAFLRRNPGRAFLTSEIAASCDIDRVSNANASLKVLVHRGVVFVAGTNTEKRGTPRALWQASEVT